MLILSSYGNDIVLYNYVIVQIDLLVASYVSVLTLKHLYIIIARLVLLGHGTSRSVSPI